MGGEEEQEHPLDLFSTFASRLKTRIVCVCARTTDAESAWAIKANATRHSIQFELSGALRRTNFVHFVSLTSIPSFGRNTNSSLSMRRIDFTAVECRSVQFDIEWRTIPAEYE